MNLNEVKQEIMEIVANRSGEDCLDLAERIKDFIFFNLQDGVMLDKWSGEQALDFVEQNIVPNLDALIKILEGERDERNKNSA
jgi:hypothetical protein